jgi:hypothetical protein
MIVMKLVGNSKNYGDRVKTKFLILPKHLRNAHTNKFEIRWLEKVEVVQKYRNFILNQWEDVHWNN